MTLVKLIARVYPVTSSQSAVLISIISSDNFSLSSFKKLTQSILEILFISLNWFVVYQICVKISTDLYKSIWSFIASESMPESSGA